jgi:hypothetical protein
VDQHVPGLPGADAIADAAHSRTDAGAERSSNAVTDHCNADPIANSTSDPRSYCV